MATTGFVLLVADFISFSVGSWPRTAPEPYLSGLPDIDGQYQLTIPGVGTVLGSVIVRPSSVAAYYYDSSWNLLGVWDAPTAALNLGGGLRVTAIEQLPNGDPNQDLMPYHNPGYGFIGGPVAVGGYDTFDWNTGALGITAGVTFDPATMSYTFLSGGWEFTANVQITAGGGSRFAFVMSSIRPLVNLDAPGLDPANYHFLAPNLNPTTPQVLFGGTWEADDTLCSSLGPVTNLQITDDVTGAFEWTLPVGATAAAITLSRTGFDDVHVLISSPSHSYTPPDMYGDVHVSVRAITTYPICVGPENTLDLAITTPFVYTMGSSGITAGIFLGGTATLQFIGNPSGIYTLVPGKAYDTLYERIPTVTSQDVKIPDPFIKTAYFGE